jgi:SWI/SNF-related matrix-associated actin-dependent regulator 1 of chromatin subfamily A
LLLEGFDALIVDESHYVKSVGTPKKPVQRTVAALQIAEDIRLRQGLILLLSGTPLLNRPVELVTQLRLLGRLTEVAPQPRKGDSDKDWEYSFKFTFCGPTHNGHGYEFKGSSNLDLLNLRLRGTCYVRRLRNEVLNLDETHRIHTPLSLNGGLDAYHRIEDNFSADGPGAYLKLLTDLRLAVGLAKIPAAVDWVQDFVEENPGKKLVVWAWHIEVQKGIAAALNGAGIKAIYLKGAKDIEAAKDAFNTGDVAVIVCSLQAHREGHTLVGNGHDVTDCLFVESPWHPGAVSQAEDRINRIGREADAVFAHTLVVPDTVDQWLVDLIAAKWETFRAAADGSIAETEEIDIQNILLGLLRDKFPPKGV